MSEKEKPKPMQPKNIPKDVQVIISIMKEMGIMEYDPKTIVQLTEFVYRYATSVLEEARMYANNNPKKKFLDVDDVRLALQLTSESSFTTPLPRDVILESAHVKNYAPLPTVKPHCGLRLPPDRHCLSSCNYTLKTGAQKKAKPTYSASGGATGIKLTSKPNISYIKRTNTSGISKQTVTIPSTVLKPKIQISASNKPSMSSNGPSAMEIEQQQQGFKRKREDDIDQQQLQ